MNRIEINEERENRIEIEVVVDAYDSEERATGWYYYIADGVKFPFEACCIKTMSKSPLFEGEIIQVIDMADEEDDYTKGMFVKVKWKDREFGVPLEQLKPLNVNDETREIIEDWQYWIARGYDF